jgi:hypothetical protein
VNSLEAVIDQLLSGKPIHEVAENAKKSRSADSSKKTGSTTHLLREHQI